MAIIALRQRRRFMQVRRCNIKVPVSYKRIHTIQDFPRDLQEEILRYPDTVEEDSDWEPDEQVKARYADDPLSYITRDDERHREAVEQNGVPRRLHRARARRGWSPGSSPAPPRSPRVG